MQKNGLDARKPDMSGTLLFSPMTIRGVELKNRIVVPPMHQYSAVKGFPPGPSNLACMILPRIASLLAGIPFSP
jgi:2,4-dienoyl-CoA reductase-like NADH-dependent reductase (Old Yellow Enzyme family)